ncbi:MAG: GTP-binding protein [Euryarchaeota archaeon]|nr:GTP-binding protein [Euryarchaeota archaeon]
MERRKVVVLGKYDAGKSTLISRLADNAKNVEYDGITVSMDIGYKVFGNKKLYFFGTPGQERFKFLRKILSEGLDCGIVVVDSTRGLTREDMEILEQVKAMGVPYMVFVNKTDKGELDYDFGVATVKGSALHGDGVNRVVETVLAMT